MKKFYAKSDFHSIFAKFGILILIIATTFCSSFSLFTNTNFSVSGAPNNNFDIQQGEDIVGISSSSNYTNLYTASEFTSLINQNLSGKFKLNNDITLSSYTPISTFKGTLDGDGHTITISTFSNTGLYYLGLFGQTENANIKNLKLKVTLPCKVSGNVSHIGSLVGKAYNTNITNILSEIIFSYDSSVYCYAFTNSNLKYFGGIIGEATGSSTVSNCNYYHVNDVIIYTGGLYFYYGGIVGFFTGNYLKLCINSSSYQSSSYYTNIETTSSGCNAIYAGGIVGYLNSTNKLEKCANYESIYIGSSSYNSIGSAYCGGICGYSYSSITNCYSAATELSAEAKLQTIKTNTYNFKPLNSAKKYSSYYTQFLIDSQNYKYKSWGKEKNGTAFAYAYSYYTGEYGDYYFLYEITKSVRNAFVCGIAYINPDSSATVSNCYSTTDCYSNGQTKFEIGKSSYFDSSGDVFPLYLYHYWTGQTTQSGYYYSIKLPYITYTRKDKIYPISNKLGNSNCFAKYQTIKQTVQSSTNIQYISGTTQDFYITWNYYSVGESPQTLTVYKKDDYCYSTAFSTPSWKSNNNDYVDFTYDFKFSIKDDNCHYSIYTNGTETNLLNYLYDSSNKSASSFMQFDDTFPGYSLKEIDSVDNLANNNKTIWGTNSAINNGKPYLLELYW